MFNEQTYQPTSVADIVFGNDESKLRIEEIISGDEPLPAYGKSGILLYGVWGTGKTALATLLPEAIETRKTANELVMPPEFIGCQQGFSGPQVMELIKKQLSLSSLNHSALHYFILDEVDNLTKLAQQSLKSAMNTNRAIFILTTNNLSDLDKGVLDRCILVELNAAKPSQLLPLAQRMVSDAGFAIDDAELEQVIAACKGSIRTVIHNVMRVARRKSPQSKFVASNDKKAAA